MRFLLNGGISKSVTHLIGSTTTYRVQFTNDDGSPVDISSGTIEVIFYATAERTTIAKTVAVTPTAVVGAYGFGTFTLVPAETIITLGTTYYLWGRTTISTVVTIGSSPCTMLIK